jgi:phosphate/phosphite/phosphonate ABC transporter binding protein
MYLNNYKSNIGILTAILFFILTSISCSKEAEYKYVDFSQRIPETGSQALKPSYKTLNVAVAAMISPKETFEYYHEMLKYIGESAGHYQVQLIQRKTYGEVNELLKKGRIDLAFICSGPYAIGKEKYGFEALATPVVRSKPFYHSYLIVNKTSKYKSLVDLRGHIFAFTDPDSNTGALVPNYWVSQIGERSNSFFSKVVYTYSHDNSILAVAKGLVDGAAVDGHKWEYFASSNPIYTSKTRIIRKSKPFGSPPLVAAAHVSNELKQKIRNLMVKMHEVPEGRSILKKLMIERFSASEEEWYQPVRDIYRVVQSMKDMENEA